MRSLVLAAVLLVACAAWARGDQVAVVVDRGAGAEEREEALIERAVALVNLFRDREIETHLYVYGTRPSGRVRAAELKGDPAKALKTASTREGWMLEGPTDPRHALHTTVRRNRGDEPVVVILVGPFEGALDEKQEAKAAEALETWNTRAPVGSRVLADGLSEARAPLVREARGWVGDATFVLGAGEPTVETTPYSPLAEAPLRAGIRTSLDRLEIGSGRESALLLAESSRKDDEVVVEAGVVRVERSDPSNRVATLSFRAPEDPGVIWLAEVPEPVTFQWTDLAPDARLESPGSPVVLPFQVEEGVAGRRYTHTYRIVRSRTDPAPAWKSSTPGYEWPEGLEVTVGKESVRDETTTFCQVEVSFTPEAAKPVTWEGRVSISTEDHGDGFEIPVRLEVPPGRVAVTLEAPTDPLPLPPDEDDRTWTLHVEAQNENVPPHVQVRAVVEPVEAAERVAATLTEGGAAVAWDLAQPIELRVGAVYELEPTSKGLRALEATISLAPVAQAGVEVETAGEGRIAARNPRMVVEHHAYAYRVEDKRVVGDPPLVVRLDPDGGPADWLSHLREIPPTVENAPDEPVRWSLRRLDADRWVLEATGSWRGERGETFSSRRESSTPHIGWPLGPSPGAVRIQIAVPPRWGSAGWILVALAALAIGLAFLGLAQLRPVPLRGILLYTMEERERAVGRLDLSRAGRRPVAVRAAEDGVLGLGGKGDAIAMLKPTRVGGLLVVVADGAVSGEHLLVDGLTVKIRGYRLRYASGTPDDAAPPAVEPPSEELLGPEFDLEGGRITALGDADEEEARS